MEKLKAVINKYWKVYVAALIIAAVCDLIGTLKFNIGIGTLTLFPMVLTPLYRILYYSFYCCCRNLSASMAKLPVKEIIGSPKVYLSSFLRLVSASGRLPQNDHPEPPPVFWVHTALSNLPADADNPSAPGNTAFHPPGTDGYKDALAWP